MKNKRHSIKDIAAALNVSVTTVSFVLNGKAREKRISEEVTKKVLDYAKSINYKPNQLAQSLRTGRSKIIVVMVEDISNYFFSKLARIIEDIAYDKGYKVLFCSNENKDERSRDLINLFRERQVDGYIIVPSPGIQDDIAELVLDDIPVVLFDRYFPEIETNYVIIDNSEAVHKASQHLVNNSYKNIGFVTIASNQTQMEARQRGYREAMKANDLNEFVLEVPFYEKNIEKVKELIKEYIAAQDLDAIFFATNYLTQIGLEVIRESYPKKINELGIITFDDNDLFKIYFPPITAVSQPLEEIGEELMTTVLKMLKNASDKPYKNQKILSASLIERNSSFPNKSRA
ncbi:substrate-binding domain-containing protein [Zunongwangia sp. SCSIO 43204]|uniref:LacI family DNA-binding transcriptional regulator n=1 Tax=Zunongwangia sp. SCSIO 43204 TaxID=2779359 RepID=UPI001CAA3FF9|nr:substrate-binding domain-containing protein [Zunongwangia sp. SCSIO 43204]UAB83228.1 substrate-binding domain-containing protein [Zunongwangia sp. SCSIO 43204]